MERGGDCNGKERSGNERILPLMKWDGREVLAALPPCCPVIIHTSNGERGTWMMGEFHLGGWEYHRVAALGDDWIEEHWRRVVRRILRRRPRPAGA